MKELPVFPERSGWRASLAHDLLVKHHPEFNRQPRKRMQHSFEFTGNEWMAAVMEQMPGVTRFSEVRDKIIQLAEAGFLITAIRNKAGGVAGVNPKDALEGMMAAQLFASHAAAMECYRRAMLPDQSTDGRQTNLTQAAKLTRANAAQMEALAKHRGKGQQKVTVEHVHVHKGGQAIVGNVEGVGGGVRTKLEDQPHALEHTQGETLRRENPERETLPIARDA